MTRHVQFKLSDDLYGQLQQEAASHGSTAALWAKEVLRVHLEALAQGALEDETATENPKATEYSATALPTRAGDLLRSGPRYVNVYPGADGDSSVSQRPVVTRGPLVNAPVWTPEWANPGTREWAQPGTKEWARQPHEWVAVPVLEPEHDLGPGWSEADEIILALYRTRVTEQKRRLQGYEEPTRELDPGWAARKEWEEALWWAMVQDDGGYDDGDRADWE